MDPSHRSSAEDFVVRALRALDARDYDAVAAGFAESGVWERGGETLVGPSAVREALAKRPADLATQHIATNMTVDAQGDADAMVRYTILAYAATAGTPQHLHAILKAEDRLVRTGSGWRFRHRTATPAFAA